MWIKKNSETMMTNKPLPQLFEALEYKDMIGMIKPTVHVDEFASKMGDDEDIIVLSFFVRSEQAARDLVNWFEKGYDWVMDSDRSPGEIRPGRYLVYVEMRRRSTAGTKAAELISDFDTLTELAPDHWQMVYNGETMPFTVENFNQLVPLSPKDYRARKEKDLNEMRISAGIEPQQIYERTREIQQLQSAAGI